MVRCERYTGWVVKITRIHAHMQFPSEWLVFAFLFTCFPFSVFGNSTDEAEAEEEAETIVKLMTFFIVYCTFLSGGNFVTFPFDVCTLHCIGNGNSSNFFSPDLFLFVFLIMLTLLRTIFALISQVNDHSPTTKIRLSFVSEVNKQELNFWKEHQQQQQQKNKKKNDGILQCNFVPSHDKQPLDLCVCPGCL